MSREGDPDTTPILEIADAFSPQGCGAGTENSCFALSTGLTGNFVCAMLLSDQSLAGAAGVKLGWRVNVDPTDGKAWCPKGALDNSKIAE